MCHSHEKRQNQFILCSNQDQTAEKLLEFIEAGGFEALFFMDSRSPTDISSSRRNSQVITVAHNATNHMSLLIAIPISSF